MDKALHFCTDAVIVQPNAGLLVQRTEGFLLEPRKLVSPSPSLAWTIAPPDLDGLLQLSPEEKVCSLQIPSSLTQEMFTEHVACVRPCPRCLEYISQQYLELIFLCVGRQ